MQPARHQIHASCIVAVSKAFYNKFDFFRDWRYMFSITFMYYAMMGCLICILTGLIVSYFTGIIYVVSVQKLLYCGHKFSLEGRLLPRFLGTPAGKKVKRPVAWKAASLFGRPDHPDECAGRLGGAHHQCQARLLPEKLIPRIFFGCQCT